ncbi:DUF2911 domain-containing protein [Pseudochryseolinea flava]|uniref:DUF2911 domain-containing protein n=2 Tax=Pseudochryseolinea flava TaxID=2059302 RepID=A0A364XYI0_9BACT|nr:DUF2911 domain-containing protein [Pseudochryseolinea flava]
MMITAFASIRANAQEVSAIRPSPLAIASMKYKDAYVKIVYSQPRKKGRSVFGGLVPYGKVWRTGANEATEITITKDITVNSILLRAGNYSLFTIPNKEKWTVIINSELGLWGAYNYNQKLDVIRFDVPVQKTTNTSEAFSIICEAKNNVADILISWDDVQLSIPVKFLN